LTTAYSHSLHVSVSYVS